MPSSRDLVCD
jgi:2-(1,2-epoxy-1,2-dihydrophenyl)acetyl-CoA isomerase